MVVFPDSEELFRVSLALTASQVLGGTFPCATKPPNPRPHEFFVVRRVGGIARDFTTDVPYILIEAWADTEARASRMASVAQGFVHWVTNINGFSILDRSEISGPLNFPDGLSAQARYTATYAIAVRASETFTPA